MFAAERLRIIKRILLEQKIVDVSSLSSILSVSEVTVRRDLEKLEKQNFLIRTHGGAEIKGEDEEIETVSTIEPKDELHEERKIIGKIASYMIHDNDTIILGPGKICVHIANSIKNKKNIKVVTTDIHVALELLNDCQDIRVVLPGGDLDPLSYQLTGKVAENNLKNIYVNRAFIEVDGVSMSRGLTVDSTEKASIINEMIMVARETVFLCDYTKFDNISFYPVGPLTMAKTIISNEQTPDTYKNYFFESNISLFTTFDVCKEA